MLETSTLPVYLGISTLVVVKMPRKLTTKEILIEHQAQTAPKGMAQLRVVLHNIRSMHNVGSVFRSSDAFGIAQILLSGYTATPPRDEITKTAIGAEEFVRWKYEQDIESALRDLKVQGYEVIGLEQTNESISLLDLQISADQKVCLVMGNEVTGIDNNLLPLVDTFVAIPQFGNKHSLNVSVATGVALYAFLQKFWAA